MTYKHFVTSTNRMRCILKCLLKFCTSYCLNYQVNICYNCKKNFVVSYYYVHLMRYLVPKANLLLFAKCHNKNNKNNNNNF